MDEYFNAYDNYTETEYMEPDTYQEETPYTDYIEESPKDTASDNTELMEKIDALVNTLTAGQNYGSLGDYYNQSLGFTVFPDHDTYAFFIDEETDGHLWTCASDNHYVPVACLEVYEAYLMPEEDPEETEPEPTEHDIYTLETLEGISGTLTAIKTNDSAYYEEMLIYQEKLIVSQNLIIERLELNAVLLIATGFFTALSCGSRIADVFFNRMKG